MCPVVRARVARVRLVRRAWDWTHTHEGRKLVRYTSVSGISTVISAAALFLYFTVFFDHQHEVLATVLANMTATVPSYYLNRTWAWGKRGRSHLVKEVLPFWGMSMLGITVSIFGAALAKHIGEGHSDIFKTLVVQAANLASFGTFWVLKILLFNRLFHLEVEEFDEHLTAEEAAAVTHGETPAS